MNPFIAIVEGKVSRNQDNVKIVTETSFWIDDQKQDDDTNQIVVEFTSHQGWLKVNQLHGHYCYVFPIDGPKGVFEKRGLPISRPIQYEWHTENETKLINAGDCDCLIIHEKFHFLEFKTDASSHEITQINNSRNKAEAQLAKSLLSFRERLNTNFESVCVLVVPKFFSYPKFTATVSSQSVNFLKKYRCRLIEVPIHEPYLLK